MRVSFESSHVTGDFSDGQLVVQVVIEDDAKQFTHADEIVFNVPPDFHAHNDLVAAALMAVVGRGFDGVRFNFPISARCAATLPLYHQCGDVSPVDPDLEPRRPGRHLGVSFSGGLDSLAMLTLLRECAGLDVKVITAEYDGFHREAVGYASYRRDVSCYTNFRRVFGDRGKRFDTAVPLLFADYLDLRALVTGHHFASDPILWIDPRVGEPPEYLPQSWVPEAGGLGEIHIARCFHTAGLLKFLVAAAPERVEAGFHVTSRPGTQKYFVKAMILRHVYRELGLPIPPFLNDLTSERIREGMQSERLIHLWTIWEWRFLDRPTAVRLDRRIREVDWSPLSRLSLAFFWKYCPLTARLIPDDDREPVLAGLEANGIMPYTDQDYDELAQVRQFILNVNPPGTVTFE